MKNLIIITLIKVNIKIVISENWKLISTNVQVVSIIFNKLFLYNIHLNLNFKKLELCNSLIITNYLLLIISI